MVAAEVLFLEDVTGAGRPDLGHGPLARGLPLGGREVRPAQQPRSEVLASVPDISKNASFASRIWPSTPEISTPTMLASASRRIVASRS